MHLSTSPPSGIWGITWTRKSGIVEPLLEHMHTKLAAIQDKMESENSARKRSRKRHIVSFSSVPYTDAEALAKGKAI